MIGDVLDATLLLLAGGASRRMGRSKALLPIAGTTLLEWQLARLGPAFPEVLVSVGEGGPALAGAAPVADRLPGRGPLGGIEAGLTAASRDALLVVACDMPRVPLELLRRLLALAAGHDAAAAAGPRGPEPVCACYRRSALTTVTRNLDAGRLVAADTLADLDTAWADGVDPMYLWNINTPDDYQLFLSSL